MRSLTKLALAPLTLLALLTLAPAAARAQGTYTYSTTVGNVTPQLWVPPGVARLRGVMAFADWLLAPGWAGSADFRAVATRLEVGVVLLKGGELFKDYPGRCKSGEYENIPKALVELGKLSKHPELAVAPVIGVGHSHGGDYWNWFNACHPERVAMIFCKSCGGVQYSGAGLRTPVLQEIGMNDLNETGSGKPRAGMFINRRRGATMALVLGPGEMHQDFGAAPRQMVLDLLEAIAKLRLPAIADGATAPAPLPVVDEHAGWLGDNYSKAIAAYAMFTGDKALSSFLPTADLATKWKMTGAMLPASIKLPTDDCGWCGHPTDEPPLPPDMPGLPDAGPPPTEDAGVADAGVNPMTDMAPVTGEPTPPDAAGSTTQPPQGEDAGASKPPATKKDAAPSGTNESPPKETTGKSETSSGGCSVAPRTVSGSSLTVSLFVLLWATMLLHRHRRVRVARTVTLIALGGLTMALPARASDNGLGDKPLMGWSSWSHFKKSINETVIKQQADAMAANLKQFGYTYINLDAGWRDSTRWDANGYETWDTSKFPNGIPALAAYVHSKGLKLGIYLHPGMDNGPNSPYELNTPIVGTSFHAKDITDATQNGNTNASAYKIDFTKPGATEYVQGYANLMASWGIDYIKFDFVGPGGGTTTADNREDMRQWAQALKNTAAAGGNPVWIELSNSLSFTEAALWKTVANGWRIEGDIESGTTGTLTKWTNVAKRFTDAPKWTPFAGPGGWSDFDAVPIGDGSTDGITATERTTTMTLWAIGCTPLILGSNLAALDSADKAIITNAEVIAVNQAGRPATPISQASTSQVWRAQNADGSFTVALFNLGSSTATVTAKWSDLGISGQATVRDLWSHTDLGTFSTSFGASLATHASRLLTVAPVAQVVLAPQFSPGGGSFTTAQDVTITSGTPSAQIRYTTDGSTPSATVGTLYTGPVHIAATTTLKAVAFATGMTTSAVTSATYTIGSTFSFEAESITFVASGATASIQNDVNSSGGHWEQLAADTVGDFIDFTLPAIPAGTYQIQMQWKGNNNRGQLSFKVDGTQLGSTLDQYTSTQTYPITTFGTMALSAGTHVVRLTCTGKNASSSAMNLSADRFILIGQ